MVHYKALMESDDSRESSLEAFLVVPPRHTRLTLVVEFVHDRHWWYLPLYVFHSALS